MRVRVVTGSDILNGARKSPQITLRAFLCSFHRSDVVKNISRDLSTFEIKSSGQEIDLT